MTEDRKQFGLILINNIKDNITLPAIKKVSQKGVINASEEIREAEKHRTTLKIKTPNVFELVGNLSGGNQQKVSLAKWIMTQPEVLILDEPTRGIDVGAKYEVYTIINDLAKQGKGIIVISSELAELLGICDRMYVMSEGKIKGELTRGEATQEGIMKYILS